MSATEILKKLLSISPWATDGQSEETPVPWCFYCKNTSWGQDIEDHAKDCPWLLAHQALEKES